MAKKNINQDRDNGIPGELLTRKDNATLLDQVLALEKPIVDAKGNTPAASFWSTGRGCPKCKRTLRIKELNQDTGIVSVWCRCGAEYHHPDIESTSDIGDKIHREISDSLVMRWMSAREEELDRE